MKLTGRQLEAIDSSRCSRDACIVAGPGSGKTTVLVEYFRQLVESGVPLQRILAITFTERAAANMKEKLAEAFQDRPSVRCQLERAYVSTVHGFCTRLLRENAILAGVDPGFRVMDEQETAWVQMQAVNEAVEDAFTERPQAVRGLMLGLASPEIHSTLVSVYEAMRVAGVRVTNLQDFQAKPAFQKKDLAEGLGRIRLEQPVGWSERQREHLEEVLVSCQAIVEGEGFPKLNCRLSRLRRGNAIYEQIAHLNRDVVPALQRTFVTDLYASERQLLMEVFCCFDRRYRERKQRLAALDFTELEEFVVQLLVDNAGVQHCIQCQFEHVLMDEFQDTNGLQAKLLSLVRRPGRFYAVGDINQSIYGFRHADPEVFREYRTRVGQRGVVELMENWRSRPEILHAVETIMHGADGVEERRLLPARPFAEKVGPSVEIISALGESTNEAFELEAQWIARRIRDLAGSSFGDVAVLVRNSEVFGVLTRALDEFHVPHVVTRGKGFYETREVRDLTHLLRVLVNSQDEISMATVLRSPFVEISDEALLRLKRIGNLGHALFQRELDSNFKSDDKERLLRFRDQLRKWRVERDHVSIDRLLLRAIDETGYECTSGPRGEANVEKFVAMAREASSRQSLTEFTEQLELLRKSDPREAEAAPDGAVNAVQLMTVHGAKGLEFPVVFVSALHKGVNQSVGNVSFSPRVGLGVRWRNAETSEDQDDWFQHEIRKERKQKEEHESQRLFYVAMTRAQEHLVLSFSGDGEWSSILERGLDIDLRSPRESFEELTSPYGEQFSVRVLCTHVAPEKLPPPEREDILQAPRYLARPAMSDQHDGTASVSSITQFVNCPRRYFLGGYLGWDGMSRARIAADHTGDVNDLPADEFGAQVHALLAGASVPQPDAEAARLAEVFRQSELGRRAAESALVEREFAFLLALEDVVLQGRIDLWFEEDGGAVTLVDYKTDAVEPGLAAQHAQSYALQLRLYALALARLRGKVPAQAFVYLLRPNVTVPIDLDSALLTASQQAVRDFRQAQSSLQFPLREGEHCQRCPFFRGLCPAGIGAGAGRSN